MIYVGETTSGRKERLAARREGRELSMEELDEVTRNLRNEAETHSSGRFSVDPDRLMDKLVAHRMPPGYFLLSLVRAAHLSGAGELSIKLNSHSLRCRFDGRPLTEKDWSSLTVREQ